MLKSLWARLTGGTGGPAAESASDPVEYKGYRIIATPFAEGGQYQTAGVIEKDFGGETKQHRFIRAEKHGSRGEAESFSITKGQQIVDQQGDRVFD
ncbi:HlyU family transcriptional regulator [Alsobacter sp. SYSU M60028]|uniref:HlyU family transcriptional regulator n=1 Tax=Alsobacter ponti TaxID=2962936 RepID=A0ABT1LEC4_9HYPH|nr:HlyU family transcriptional regulator [Alsobacter ponti]MCP8939276.1 HlyU family transcriptional regulator [Alsobacter ponti]